MIIWCYLGTIYLLILTYQDFTRNMKINDRHNYFMAGYTVSLFSLFSKNISNTTLLILFVIGINIFMTKFFKSMIGKGDINAFSWIFLGWSIIGVHEIITQIGLIVGGTLILYYIINKFKFQKFPYFIVLLITYVTTCIIFKCY